jgi:hypothetical protein
MAKFIHKGIKEYSSFPDIIDDEVDNSLQQLFAG